MRHSLKKLLALLLALLMALSLAACSESGADGDTDDGKGGSNGGEGGSLISSVSDDPAGYIAEAAGRTMEDISRRYSGSPLAAMAQVLERRGALDLQLDIDVDGEAVGVSGRLSYDADASRARLDATANIMGSVISGALYFDKDFVGVSVPLLLGDDAFYGVRPYDFYDQVSGSVLAQYMTPESLETIKQLDDMMAAFSDVQGPDAGALDEKYQAMAEDLNASMELKAEEYSDGGSVSGWHVYGSMDSDAMAGFMSDLYDVIFDSAIWDTMDQIAKAGGGELEMSTTREEIDEQLREIRDSGVSCKCDYYILDGLMVEAVVTPVNADGQEIPMKIDFYDGNAITVSYTVDGEDFRLSSAVSDANGYEHTVTVVSGGETYTLSCSWGADGQLTLRGQSGLEAFGLTAGLQVSGGGFTLSDLALESDGETLELPLTLSYTPGVSPEVPGDMLNFFELSEEDYDYLASTFQLLGA